MTGRGDRSLLQRGPEANRHSELILSGFAGFLLSALIFFVARQIGIVLGVLVPIHAAELVCFVILLVISLIEMPVVIFGLRQIRLAKANRMFVLALKTLFVAFASVYAGIQVVLFGESEMSHVLVLLGLARWVASSWAA